MLLWTSTCVGPSSLPVSAAGNWVSLLHAHVCLQIVLSEPQDCYFPIFHWTFLIRKNLMNKATCVSSSADRDQREGFIHLDLDAYTQNRYPQLSEFIGQRWEGKKKKKKNQGCVEFFSKLVLMDYPLSMSFCSLTVKETLDDWLRHRHFLCDLEGPEFHQWNRCVFSSHAEELLLMLTLETRGHNIYEKYCW